ncbi:MAG: carbamoyltransferase N-terminal domain-containing protein [Candidatus Sulfotelmatobacter sp.]
MIDIEDRVHFPHSLGVFYQAMTQYLGFPHYGDEYNVMRLAPYGKPIFLDEMRKIVRLQNGGCFDLDVCTSSAITSRKCYTSGWTARPRLATCSRGAGGLAWST